MGGGMGGGMGMCGGMGGGMGMCGGMGGGMGASPNGAPANGASNGSSGVLMPEQVGPKGNKDDIMKMFK